MVFARTSSLSCVECLLQSRLRDTDTIHFDEDGVAYLDLGAILHGEGLDVLEREVFVDMVGFRDRLVCGSRNNSDPSSLCMILWNNQSPGREKSLLSYYMKSWPGHRQRRPLHLHRRLLKPGLFVLPGAIVILAFVHY